MRSTSRWPIPRCRRRRRPDADPRAAADRRSTIAVTSSGGGSACGCAAGWARGEEQRRNMACAATRARWLRRQAIRFAPDDPGKATSDVVHPGCRARRQCTSSAWRRGMIPRHGDRRRLRCHLACPPIVVRHASRRIPRRRWRCPSRPYRPTCAAACGATAVSRPCSDSPSRQQPHRRFDLRGSAGGLVCRRARATSPQRAPNACGRVDRGRRPAAAEHGR